MYVASTPKHSDSCSWSSIISPITINLDLQVTGQEVNLGSLATMNFMNLSSNALQSPQTESNGLSMNNPECKFSYSSVAVVDSLTDATLLSR